MTEVFAVIRAVERKFGQFVEYQAIRDYEMPDKYFGLIFAAFMDPQAIKAVPPSGLEMSVPVPYKERRERVGWEDIEWLLEAQDRDPSYGRGKARPMSGADKELKKDNVLFFRVMHSKKELDTPAPMTCKADPAVHQQDLVDFWEWGRSLPLKPIMRGKPIADQDLFEAPETDYLRLRAALRYASQLLGVSNPHEIHPDDPPRPAVNVGVYPEGAFTKKQAVRAPLTARPPPPSRTQHDPSARLKELFANKRVQ
ncbi:hypothetical protein CC1G_09347 [Coprinopsis cinerea okayama7|uniref:Uncharacterized protein n=1 Tax=Coprinopsis cinerea (strain Okayama-7 / 130 / ATCC MYA-4618 / FGSC 9003) TaxID=240176 RepID=A8N5P2_COPC7|nr:hypothetical protein CC1G_09347 [Coprinopsis cinerea okayama7\|eukprot:XP_001830187.1 hypothetical protein CC1G_09347 [Coprinopsis cinerea okayama7\